MRHRFAAALRGFPTGLYLSELTLGEDARGLPTQVFRLALGAFVRGGIYLDFADEPAARRELESAGFTAAALHHPSDFEDDVGEIELAGARRIRIIEALVTRS